MVDKGGQAGDGGMFRRRTGVTALGTGHKPHIRIALFQNPQHGVVPLEAGHGSFHHSASLIQHQIQLDALIQQMLHRFGGALPHDLLVAGAGYVYVHRRRESVGQQAFHRLQNGAERALGVHGSTGPISGPGPPPPQREDGSIGPSPPPHRNGTSAPRRAFGTLSPATGTAASRRPSPFFPTRS